LQSSITPPLQRVAPSSAQLAAHAAVWKQQPTPSPPPQEYCLASPVTPSLQNDGVIASHVPPAAVHVFSADFFRQQPSPTPVPQEYCFGSPTTPSAQNVGVSAAHVPPAATHGATQPVCVQAALPSAPHEHVLQPSFAPNVSPTAYVLPSYSQPPDEPPAPPEPVVVEVVVVDVPVVDAGASVVVEPHAAATSEVTASRRVEGSARLGRSSRAAPASEGDRGEPACPSA
jgi:hypothetical protein